ncbi:hypothetical protein FRC11_014263 [Ceratobasidium sp. 423]|nr:hypothetical protein FRC11_014263 [Ceratobasidium sp. 423]
MDHTLRDQQAQWREGNTRRTPASEGELLDLERELGILAMKKRQRVLYSFTVAQNVENGLPVPVNEVLLTQDFRGLKIVGAVSTLLGQEGLHAQGLWYGADAEFDWYWASITDLLTIEVREDVRFRGGAKCIWLTTAIAEYAMTIPHATYNHHWESALVTFNAPRLDVWPRHEYRPCWWPAESAGLWPGKKLPSELPHVVTREEELRRLMEQLSVDPTHSLQSWRRLGHYGDARFPGQPPNHLDQLLPWDLRYGGGIKLTRDPPGDSSEGLRTEEGEVPSGGHGEKKRKMNNHGGRRVRRGRK